MRLSQPVRHAVWTIDRAPWLCAAVLLLAAGCASAPVKRDTAVVFPPAPELPRLQFMLSMRGLKDVEKQSAFNRFVVGEMPDVKLSKPYGAALADGKLYVCDTNATVAVFDFKNRTYEALKGANGAGRLSQPLNISIGADGTRYVTDPVRGQVVAFDRNDAYVKAYGKQGEWRPVDAVAAGGKLYVADMAAGLVKVLDLASGAVVGTIGDKGEPADRLDRPTNLATDAEGFIYVTDVGKFKVFKFAADGALKASFGGPGDNLGHFARPKGIAVDKQGRLYAVDASFNNVQIFNKDGRLLLYFGEGGEQAGNLLLPAKVTIDYDNVQYFQQFAQPGFEVEYLVVVTGQFGSRLVNVYGYGRQKGKQYPNDADLLKSIEERRRTEAARPR